MSSADARTTGTLERRRLAVFLLFAFGIAWATAGVLAANGGLTDSPAVLSVGGFSLTLATLLLPTTYMFAPGIANLLARRLTDEGFDDLAVSFSPWAHGWAYAAAWIAPGLLTALGAGLFFLVFPAYFDPTASSFASVAGGADLGIDPLTLVAVTVLASVTINPLVNALFGFGEELGWRGYLLPKLLPIGARRAVVAHGLIWGAWHWPLILLGYEYGFGYVGAPWSGLAVFLVFAVGAGTFLAWLTLRTGSVLPASLAHGAINATVVVAVVFATGEPNPLLGPLPVGLVGALPWVALAAALLFRLPDDATLPTPGGGRSVTGASGVDE